MFYVFTQTIVIYCMYCNQAPMPPVSQLSSVAILEKQCNSRVLISNRKVYKYEYIGGDCLLSNNWHPINLNNQ